MKNKESYNLIIVGTGSYVCGKGANEYGTIAGHFDIFKKVLRKT